MSHKYVIDSNGIRTWKRKPLSEITKARIGAANRGRYVGRKLSNETKTKMKLAQQARWRKYQENPALIVERNKKYPKLSRVNIQGSRLLVGRAVNGKKNERVGKIGSGVS